MKNFCAITFCFLLALAAPAAHAATITGDIFVDFFVTGTDGDLLLFEAGALTSDPAGAETVTFTALLDFSGPAPVLVSGDVAITDVSGDDYLSGVLEAGSFTFGGAVGDPLSFDLAFDFSPLSGSALAFFQPAFVMNIDGEFSSSGSSFLADGIVSGSGVMNVSQVPVPGALPLFATALGAIAIWRHRRSAARV